MRLQRWGIRRRAGLIFWGWVVALVAPGLPFFRSAAAQTVRESRSQRANDPIVRVYLLEAYWPTRFNLTDDLYRAAYSSDNPRRRYWRLIDEGKVDTDAAVAWKAGP